MVGVQVRRKLPCQSFIASKRGLQYPLSCLSDPHVSWQAQPLTGAAFLRLQCYEAEGAQPEQRVCAFQDLVLYNGKILYITDSKCRWGYV